MVGNAKSSWGNSDAPGLAALDKLGHNRRAALLVLHLGPKHGRLALAVIAKSEASC